MGALVNLKFSRKNLEELLKYLDEKNTNYGDLTVSLENKLDNYGHCVKSWISQTPEERASKALRKYGPNGNTFWSDQDIFVHPYKKVDQTFNSSSETQPKAAPATQRESTRTQSVPDSVNQSDDLPF